MLRSLISVDRMIGALMRQLRSEHELNNTLVVFASDNGFMWGEHGDFGKSDPYLPSVQVPLFLRWPGHVPAGEVDRRLVALLDIAPTVLDAAGVEPTHPMDGEDLLDPTANRKELLLEFWIFPGHPTPSWTGIVTKRYEYVEYTDENGRLTFREYYDLVHDPYQLTNLLAGTPPPTMDVNALSAELARLRTCVGLSCPT
jgi:arylsulfatase A-like enzyme